MSDAEQSHPQPPEGDWLGTKFVRFERHGSIAYCVIDRPDRRNALTAAMYFALRYAINRVDADPDLVGLIITATGDVFIPGGDMSQDSGDDWGAGRFFGMDVTPFETIRQARKPIVCAINGLCQAGGLMIAMLSDLSVASDRATFRAPELLRGIADLNYAEILPRQIGPARARDMLMTGRTVTAEEALDWGLVSRIAQHDDLADVAHQTIREACGAAPEAWSMVKRSFDQYYGLQDRIGMAAGVRSQEAVEGFTAFKERRNPTWVPEDLRTEGRL